MRRTASGQRRYGREHIRRPAFIRRLRDLWFGVEGVRELVCVVGGHAFVCGGFKDFARARLSNMQEKMRDARWLERELRCSCRTCAALLFGIGAISTTTPPRLGK